jgi:acetyl esterase/lipase
MRWRRLLFVPIVVAAVGASMSTATRARADTCALTPTANECQTYGSDVNGHQTFDVYYSSKTPASPRPAVLLIHGGGWVSGSKTYFNHVPTGVGRPPADARKPKNSVSTNVARYLADQYGWLVVSMDYRLGANPKFPGSSFDTDRPYADQPVDVDAVVYWIKTEGAATYGVDPNRIGLIGGSAGAHLALLHAYTHHTGNPDKVKAVVSWAGPTDMASLALAHGCVTTTCQDPTGQQWVGPDILAFEGGCPPSQCPVRYANTSPVRQIQMGDPPTLLVQGLQDLTVPPEQAVEMRTQLVAKLITPHEVRFCADCEHADITVFGWYYTERFLTANL